MDSSSLQNGLFSGWPLALRQAHLLIRASRNARYFEMADQFAASWADTLEIGGRVELLSGSNMAALDSLFEHVSSKADLQRLYGTFQRCTDRQRASVYAASFAHKQPASLEEAVALHVAFLTVRGSQRAASVSQIAARDWLRLWQEAMEQQNKQQLRHSAICLTPEQLQPEPVRDFEEGIEKYLEQFSETGALSVAVVGALPFSAYFGADLLSAISVLLRRLAPLFRLAQDVRVDVTEALNAGIYATAAVHQLSFGAARQGLESGAIPVSEIEQRLRKLWECHFARAALECEKRLDPYRDSQIGIKLAQFCDALLDVAQMLTGRWKA